MDFSAQNPTTTNALSLAARNNDVKSVRRLISKINPNCVDNRGWTCLHEAAFNDSVDALKEILGHRRCRPLVESHEGHTVLYVACQNIFSTRCIKYILENIDDIANFGSREGFTPLHLVSHQGREDVVQMLIDYGAIIDVVDFDGDSPLHEACQGRQPETVNILLHAGAIPDIKNEQNVTPLHMACASGSLQSVQYLMPFVPDINVIDSFGDTPLIVSVRGENEELVEFLLQNGADPNIKNSHSKLAIDFAMEKGLVKSFKLLFEVTDVKQLNINLVYRALSQSYLNIDILEMLFKSDLDAEFFLYNEHRLAQTDIQMHQLSAIPEYKDHAPLNTLLNVSEYIYTLSPEKFREFFFLALIRGLSTNADHYYEEVPPLVWLHYCPHSACFEEVFHLLVEHGCDVDYCCSLYCSNENQDYNKLMPDSFKNPIDDLLSNNATYLPDAFLASILLEPTTLPMMIPYSIQCDPEYILKFANDGGFIEQLPNSTLSALIKMVDSKCEIMTYDVFKYHVPPLKHLIRLQIRKIIKGRNTQTLRQFRNILDQLPIPNVMKRYVRFL